jgi:predicted phosphodiesterase
MKIAVLSDIHGFSLAFDRVLEDIQSVPGIDQIVIAGDLCEGGPDPKGVLDRIASLEAVVLQGNTDRDLANADRSSASAQFTMDQIGDEGLAYLRSLPFPHRVTPPDSDDPWDELLVVHANPFDQDRHVPPDAGAHELRELIGDTEAAVIAFGHLHIAYIRDLERTTLIDVSAVGNPKDRDLRSKWGLIEWSSQRRRWISTLHYVDYPLEETIEQIRKSGIPNPEKKIETLKKASY